MTSSQPPRIALALLDRLVADPALIGDLIEEFRSGRSRLWFWQQALHAIRIGSSPLARAVRPLKLGTDRPGIGGFGLIALGALMTATLPALWWFVFYGVTGGAVLAMVAICRHRLSDEGDTADKETL